MITLKESLEAAQLIPQVINLYLQDSAHEEFDIEEEDQIKALNDLGFFS